MSTYIIGDVHSCYRELKLLLEKIDFSTKDKLVFTGDLINGGPYPIDTLNLIMDLNVNNKAKVILGNHDLSLIALAKEKINIEDKTGFLPIIEHKKANQYISWLQRLDLLYYDDKLDFVAVHAGILPEWSLDEAIQYAKEAQDVFRGDKADDFFANMFGNEPNKWNSDLSGWDRIRFIVNVFTRMRFCHKDGSLELKNKGPAEQESIDEIPWYLMNNRIGKTRVFFGHWAAILGNTGKKQYISVDTGCMWGGKLSAYRVEDNKIFSVDSSFSGKW